MRSTFGRQPIGPRFWSQIPSNCPFASMKHEGLSTKGFKDRSSSTVLNIKRLKMPGEDLPSLKQSELRGMIQQRQREHLQIEPAKSSGVLGMQSMPLDTVLPETPPAATHLLLAQIENWYSPITIGCPAANVSSTHKGSGIGHRRPSDRSNTRLVRLLCGIYGSVRICGQSNQSKSSGVAIRSDISKQPPSQRPIYL
jgi:hypothetical protein